MIARCYRRRDKKTRLYANRRVCDRWRKFKDFVQDMAALGPRPSLQHSIDRIDNDGDYEPGNVRWATTTLQRRNRPDNRILELDGIRMTSADWRDKLGFKRNLIRNRLNNGWTVRETLTTPVGAWRRSRA
jgi:hypothetical protein